MRFAANDARQNQENLTKRLREQGQYEEVIGIPLISDFTVNVNGQKHFRPKCNHRPSQKWTNNRYRKHGNRSAFQSRSGRFSRKTGRCGIAQDDKQRRQIASGKSRRFDYHFGFEPRLCR
ncbi:MAG: hypothetical protein IPJ30_26535 [Acidobacteria bacterium]|nr:hypothetical protein [Acidobacteriota bacterium]